MKKEYPELEKKLKFIEKITQEEYEKELRLLRLIKAGLDEDKRKEQQARQEWAKEHKLKDFNKRRYKEIRIEDINMNEVSEYLKSKRETESRIKTNYMFNIESKPKEEVDNINKSDLKEQIKNDNGFNRIFSEDGGYQEFYKKNGAFTGELKMYNKNGILIKHIENLVQQGDEILVNGKEITRYDNGSLRTECCFIKGLRDGFGISYTEDGWIDQIDYYKNDEDVSWDSDENKKIMLREIKKYMNDGVNVYPVQYIGLCESLGFDPNEFKDNPNFKI